MIPAAMDPDNPPKHMRSSCCLAAIKLKKVAEGIQQLDYVTAGDCILFFHYADGRSRQVNVDHIDPLDGVAIKMLTSHWADHIGGENPNFLDAEEILLYTKSFVEE